MKALLQGIWNHLQRPGTFAGHAHQGLAPAKAIMPYVVLEPGMSMSPDYRTDRQYMQTRTVRFSVYGTSMVTVAEWIDELESVFTSSADPVILTTGHVLAVWKGGDDIDIDPDRAGSGQEVWHGILDLDFRTQRTEN